MPEVDSPRGALVRIAGDAPFALAGLRAHPERFARILERARGAHARAECLCTAIPAPLVIRARNGRFHLARWPGGGHDHHPGCPFYSADPSYSGKSACGDAVRERGERIYVKLAAGLVLAGAGARQDTGARVGGSDLTGRGIGLLALTHLLWEASALNAIGPAAAVDRDWEECRARLGDAAASCVVNGRELAAILFMPAVYRSAAAAEGASLLEEFQRVLAEGRPGVRRGFVLGELKDLRPSPFGAMIRIRHMRRPMFLSGELARRIRVSFPLVLGASPPLRKIILALVELTSAGNLAVIDCAAMLTLPCFLPADSMLEAQMAEALLARGHTIVKPLKYRGESIFPDYVLPGWREGTDVFVEVYGVHGREDYEQRKREKQKYYSDHEIAVIEWEDREPLEQVLTAFEYRLAPEERAP